MSLQTIRTQLKILASVPRHGRLAVVRTGLVLQPEVPVVTTLARFMRGDGRQTMLQALQQLFGAACEKAADLLASRHLVDAEPDRERENTVRDKLAALRADLRAAVQGVALLAASTYSQDAVVCAELEVIRHQGEDCIRQIEEAT